MEGQVLLLAHENQLIKFFKRVNNLGENWNAFQYFVAIWMSLTWQIKCFSVYFTNCICSSVQVTPTNGQPWTPLCMGTILRYLNNSVTIILYQFASFYLGHAFPMCKRSSKGWSLGDTGMSHFSKVCIMPLRFYKGFTLGPVLANRKISKQYFGLYLKKIKRGNSTQCLFYRNYYRGSMHPSRERSFMKFQPQEPHSASQHQVTGALNCVCEHLTFISI